MDQRHFYNLLDKYLLERITAAEEKEFFGLLEQPGYQQLLMEHIGVQLTNGEFEEAGDLLRKERIKTRLDSIINNDTAPVRSINWYKRIAVAAAIIGLICLGGYLLFFNQKQKNEIVKIESPVDIKAPESNRAMITLADGSKIFLDEAGAGQLAMQGNIKLVKLSNGQIVYQTAVGEVLKELQYNTLANPRGSKVIDMELADGSHVWLNAGSSITYPVAFVGNERKVSIIGEAYFEVTHDRNKPFFVTCSSPAGGGREGAIQVLGTHFNVNAYDDEEAIRVTLLEGSVRVSSVGHAILKPGQQAIITEKLNVSDDVNIDAVIAWKNGLFSFRQADLPAIMRQIARWYDVEVIYEAPVPDRKFGGEIPRMNKLSSVLKVLEESDIKFKIEKKKVIVIK